MVFCWQCKIQGKFLSGECLRKIAAIPPPSPDQQHFVVFSARRQAGLLYQPSVAPGASHCLREAPASSGFSSCHWGRIKICLSVEKGVDSRAGLKAAEEDGGGGGGKAWGTVGKGVANSIHFFILPSVNPARPEHSPVCLWLGRS